MKARFTPALFAHAEAVLGLLLRFDYPACGHNGAGSFSFDDGRVEARKWGDARTIPKKLTPSGSSSQGGNTVARYPGSPLAPGTLHTPTPVASVIGDNRCPRRRRSLRGPNQLISSAVEKAIRRAALSTVRLARVGGSSRSLLPPALKVTGTDTLGYAGCAAQTSLNLFAERTKRKNDQCIQGSNACWPFASPGRLQQLFPIARVGKRRQGILDPS